MDTIAQQKAEIERLQEAKRAALAVADERSKENCELRQQIERLRKFARWAIQEGSREGGVLEGDYVQDKAEELGLIVKTTYDPDVHGESDIAEPGDPWYIFGPLLAEPAHAPKPPPAVR